MHISYPKPQQIFCGIINHQKGDETMDYEDAADTVMSIHDNHEFAAQLCKAMGIFAYVVVASVEADRDMVAFGGWAGIVSEGNTSRAPHVAYCKMGELVLAGAGLDGKLVMTPVESNELSLHWMGGVALNGTIVAVSKMAQEHDRLLALLTLYDREVKSLKLHHVGVRFPDEETYRVNCAARENGMIRDVPGDHNRTYFPMEDGTYREHQWFPDGPHDVAAHWDFVTDDPDGLLNFIANAYGKGPVFFDDVGEHDPVGVVWISNKDCTEKIGVMARKVWWKVEGA